LPFGTYQPIAATVVALLVATLFVAGRSLQVFYQIPFSMVQLIQAILVICVASSEFLFITVFAVFKEGRADDDAYKLGRQHSRLSPYPSPWRRWG